MGNYYLLVWLYIFLLVFPDKVIAQTGLYIPDLQSIDQVIQEFMKRWDIPGASVALSKGGRLIYARGFGWGNRETSTMVTPENQFRIASLSKPITAIAIMQLVQKGKLGLDSLVFGENGILSDSAYSQIKDPRIKEITVRQLLQHTAGWDRNLSGDPMCDPMRIAEAMGVPRPADAVTIIRYALQQPLDFHPGTRFAYSNLGYSILGRVIEKISGLSYCNYVHTHIFQPLSISHTVLGESLLSGLNTEEVNYYPSSGAKKVPSVYKHKERVPSPYGGFHLEAMDAHGGWIATASDLIRLLTAVDGFDTRPDLLSQASISAMTEANGNGLPTYALGWCVNERNNWWHSGSLPGSSATMVRTQEGLTWCILFNRRSEDGNYFKELDKLMWQGIREVSTWPSHDLFEPRTHTNALSNPTDLQQDPLLVKEDFDSN